MGWRINIVSSDGTKYCHFVTYTRPPRIALAFNDGDEVHHQLVHELAIEEGFVGERERPTGGGVYNCKSRNLDRPSINFGRPPDAAITALDYYMRRNLP